MKSDSIPALSLFGRIPALLFVLWLALLLLIVFDMVRGARRYAELYRTDDGHTHPVKAWWPPRLSNCLIIGGAAHYLYDCLWHPPFGASRLSVLLSALTILAGYFYRNWE